MLNLHLSAGKRLTLLFCFLIVGFFLSSIVSVLLIRKFGEDSTPAIRIAIIIQDLLMFIVPAIATAVMVTRQPAELLDVDKRPQTISLMFAIFTVVAITPVMNAMIYLNSNLPLPADLLQTIQSYEDQAAAQVSTLMGEPNVANLIVGILIVGVLAGFSEELFFRGALQRLFITGGMNAHAAILVTAALFSLMHFQFFGFIPRMLLGVLFGYAFWWTRSLWVPVTMHVFNNTLYLIFQWFNGDTAAPSELDQLGVSGNAILDIVMIVLSLVFVAIGLSMVYVFRKPRLKKN